MGGVAFLDDGPRVLSIYEGFFSGGARALHTSLVRGLQATTGQRHSVLGLTHRSHREGTQQAARDDTSYRRLRAAGIPVTLMRRLAGQPLRGSDRSTLRRALSGADLVLTLKEQPLSALVLAGGAGPPVIACLHRSDPEHQGSALADLVSLVDQGIVRQAVCCAHSTQAAYHAATGIPLEQLPVVPNGVDLHRFRPSASERATVRKELGVTGSAPMVMLSARFDPMKDIPLFLRAAAVFAKTRPDLHVVLCGAGMSLANPALVALVTDTLRHWDAARSRVHLLGIRDDMPRLYNGADIVALTSAYGEAAPLSLLEGMACGAIPLTTDVGDAALIVADPRLVVSRDPGEIAESWAAAFEQREEHAVRIQRRRQGLSDQRCFDAYASLIAAYAGPTRLSDAV
jgi:glycosyltransferase involved in cell wall biosynthesis